MAHGAGAVPERIEARIHTQAAAVLKRLLTAHGKRKKGAALMTLTLANHIVAKKATHAITCETLKYLPVIRELVDQTRLLESSKIPPELVYVLVYEVLFGKGCRPVAAPEMYVLKRKVELKAALARKMLDAKATDHEDLLSESVRLNSALQGRLPRYVRVNTLKCTLEEAEKLLQRQKVKRDAHIDNLLVLPPGTDLHAHPLVKSGGLVLQGKGSCMPAHALAPEPSWQVIDACAAPGNKTTHLAALMQGQGTIHAFDAGAVRLKRLKANAAATGATNIVARNVDFLSLNPAEYSQVRAILLDPSCSGSGTVVARGDVLLQSAQVEADSEEADETATRRLAGLVKFQEAALQHAMSFPAVERIAYSTCSVNQAENEDVVAKCLHSKASEGWTLERALPTWPRRGLSDTPLKDQAELVVRTDVLEDSTEGFFLAVFVRERPSLEQQQRSCQQHMSRIEELSDKPKSNAPLDDKRKREKDIECLDSNTKKMRAQAAMEHAGSNIQQEEAPRRKGSKTGQADQPIKKSDSRPKRAPPPSSKKRGRKLHKKRPIV